MRVRTALAAGALLAAAAAVAPLAHARGADGLSVHGYGTVAEDSTVTLSGTYRCTDDSAGPVFVSSTLRQGNRSAGIGGTRAACDGHLHEWVNTSVVKEPAYQPGAAGSRPPSCSSRQAASWASRRRASSRGRNRTSSCTDRRPARAGRHLPDAL
ncbi:DUF6299 family protein [Streptomyces narbonensis]